MDRDRITRTGARAPGVERRVPLAWLRHTDPASSTLIEGSVRPRRTRTSECKPENVKGMPGDGLTCTRRGRRRRKGQPWSRTGENSPYGILGGRWKRRHHSKPGPRHRPTRPPPRASHPARLRSVALALQSAVPPAARLRRLFAPAHRGIQTTPVRLTRSSRVARRIRASKLLSTPRRAWYSWLPPGLRPLWRPLAWRVAASPAYRRRRLPWRFGLEFPLSPAKLPGQPCSTALRRWVQAAVGIRVPWHAPRQPVL